jgi:hypothetical protein
VRRGVSSPTRTRIPRRPVLAAAAAIGLAAAAIYLAVGPTTPAVRPVSQPNLARPQRPVPGIGVLRQTVETWRQASGYNAYSYVIAGLDLARSAAREPGRSLVYFSGADVNRRWDAGVPYREALRRGWLLKDPAGKPLVSPSYPGNYVGDVGNAAYQHAWLENVSRVLRQNGDDGVFIDSVISDLAPLAGIEAATYPTRRSWAKAELSFIRTVGEGLKAEGYYVLVNASGYVPRDPASKTGAGTAAWWRKLAPYVSGLMNEYYQETSDGTDQLRSTGPSWTQNWTSWQQLVRVAQEHGRDFIGLTYGPAGDARRMSYGRASFLLDWNGRGGAFVYQPTTNGDPWNGAWTRNLGRPKGTKRRVGVAWLRQYSRGVVLVNPDASRSQLLTLPRTYVAPNGVSVSKLTLPPRTGLVLRAASAD